MSMNDDLISASLGNSVLHEDVTTYSQSEARDWLSSRGVAPLLPKGESLTPLAQKCRENNISRHTLWRLQKRGLGPTVIRLPSANGCGRQLTCDTWWREFLARLAACPQQMDWAVR